MDESSTYSNLPTSHLLGSVPSVISEEKKASFAVPEAGIQYFPPNNGSGGSRGRGYQTLEAPTESFEQKPPNNWKGVFNISSYTQYFNVDTDVVINRLTSSFYPTAGDFFSKIDANPDLYGHIWITTTLVFMLSSFGNFATYLMKKRTDGTTSWSFDVGYVNVAASGIYGYAIVVPLAFYFLLQYLGSNASLIRFWCMWGYSLSIFIPTAFLLLIPVEFLRWMIILIAGMASSCFVYLNLRSYIEGVNDLTIMVVAAFLLQMALAIFIKVWFFP
ncbi:protein YIPF1 homolog [Hibiscus syriacus]|uniref:protein YIPF1 homolog n=1 Tax=Hibiscus syriacus TaxID=106335 RepID=UPI001921C65D|nr:protein YIPF1 homolog [Hibiscus syriacus]